jgi:hypothetical protein
MKLAAARVSGARAGGRSEPRMWRRLLALGVLFCWAGLGVPACAKRASGDSAAAPGVAMERAGGDGGQTAPAASTWKRSTLVANTSRLMVGDEESLPLHRAEIRARVDGFRARVMIDFVFRNPHEQRLEGTFQLRLPEGASPWFLAFGKTVATADRRALRIASDSGAWDPQGAMDVREEIWEQPRVARMAEREKAAIAYGDTVRQRVDPALAEWGGAGVFNARIFPIEPGGTHRVVVGYDVDLVAIGSDLELSIPLPPEVDPVLVELDVAQIDGATIDVSPGVPAQEDAGRARYVLDAPQADRVTLRLAHVPDTLLAGPDPEAGEFFATRFVPEVPSEATGAGARAAVFVLDTSLSSNPERFEIWRAMVQAILDNDRAGIDRFAVLTFSIDHAWWNRRWVDNTPENVETLMTFLDAAVLEGATDLGSALGQAAAPSWDTARTPHDTFVLSDGAATWGEDDAHAIGQAWRKAGGGALFGYDTGIEGGAPEFLATLARDSGGAVFSVVGESEVAAASVAHRARPWHIEGVAIEGGTDLMLQGRPRVVFPGQRLVLVGRGRPQPAPIELKLRQGERRTTITVPAPTMVASDLAARRYGEVAVAQLEELQDATYDDAVAYARHFRITGRTCSLVMLESEADYEGGGIVDEPDELVVRGRAGAKLVAAGWAQAGKRLGDPKARLLSELRRLETTPGVMLKLPAHVRERISRLPSSTFVVKPEALSCGAKARRGMSQELGAQLRARQPEYDFVVAEADRRLAAKHRDCALVALSSLVEANPGDAVLARDVAFTAASWGLAGQSAQLLQRVARARPWEPVTFHALAQTLAEREQIDLAIAFFEIALAGEWDPRFGDIRKIVLLDYLRLLEGQRDNGARRELAIQRAPDLRRELAIDEADLVVTIMWNTDNTDVDLHVHEPAGGHCFYGNKITRTGRLTADVTQGYGPEMYVAERAKLGTYRVRAHYFASDANRMGARTKVYAQIIRNYGTPQESVERKVVTLQTGKDVHDLVSVRGLRQ